jgi:hypothetical protein
MPTGALEDIIKQAEALTPEEQLRLISRLVERVRLFYAPAPARRRWSEIAGAVTSPLLGEDAQSWVSRSRREADEHRQSGSKS